MASFRSVISANSASRISRSTGRRAITASQSSRSSVRPGGEARILLQGRCPPHRGSIRTRNRALARHDVHNLYIPAGGDIADPALNPKFAHKLAFLDEMEAWFAGGFPASEIVPSWSATSTSRPRAGRLEPQAARRRLAHAGRNGGDEANDGDRRVGRRDASIRPPKKSFNVVELSRRRLGGGQSGPQTGPCVGEPGGGGRRREMNVLSEARGWRRPSDHVPAPVAFAARAG